MLQVVRHALSEDLLDQRGNKDVTKLSLILANRTERHVLLKGLFDALADKYSERFRVFYTVDKIVGGGIPWSHAEGLVDEAMIRKMMPAPDESDKIVLLCGPDQLLNHVAGTSMGTLQELSGSRPHQPIAPGINDSGYVGGLLGRMGYKDEDIYRF